MSLTTPEIYIGSVIEHDSEREVLNELVRIFESERQPAIILANINLGERQIDFVVAMDNLTWVLEVKGHHRPLRGSKNGTWQVQLTSGEWASSRNLYTQTLGEQHALKDAMSKFVNNKVQYPSSSLVFVPQIPSGSSLCSSDFKVSIIQLSDLSSKFHQIQRNKKDGWKLTQWRGFAKYHNLTKVSSPEVASNPILLEDAELLARYSEEYARMYAPNSEELIEFMCSEEGNQYSTEQIVQSVSFGGIGVLLQGPSGCGKSLLAAHTGMGWMQRGGIPITIPAKDFKGKIRNILDQEIALLGVKSASRLLEAVGRLNRPVLFILDGYNECEAQKRDTLSQCFKALVGRYEANFFITSQIPLARADLLPLRKIEVYKPNKELKLAIAQRAANSPIPSEVEILLETVESGLEAGLVGAVGKELKQGYSRYALFDAFVRDRLRNLASDGIRLLCRVAGWLSERITFSLSIRELDRLLDNEELHTQVLDKLFSTNLLVKRGDRVSFQHELFFNAFAAEAVIRGGFDQVDQIKAALSNPKHAEYKEMIIGAIDDNDLIQQVLEGIIDSKDITFCFYGTCGLSAKEWANTQYQKLLFRISEEVKRVQFVVNNLDQVDFTIVPETLENWSTLDLLFISNLPELLAQGFYLFEMLNIVAHMDRKITETIDHFPFSASHQRLKSNLFGKVYALQWLTWTGLTKVCSQISGKIFTGINGHPLREIVQEKFTCSELTQGQLYLLLALSRQVFDQEIIPAPVIQKVIEQYWNGAPYHLKLQLMYSAESCWKAEEPERTALITAIEALLNQSSHPFISTAVMDALKALGALEEDSEAHKKEVQSLVEKILANPEDSANWELAGYCYGAQIDHPYSTAYEEVISELSENNRKEFLTIAAKGLNGSDPLILSALVPDLASFKDPKLGEIISQWTEVPQFTNFMANLAIDLFMTAHIFLGRLGCVLPNSQQRNDHPSNEVLIACGKILYWSNRLDISEVKRQLACQESVEILLKNENGVALDAIKWSEETQRMHRFAKRDLPSIIGCFPNQVAEVCRRALQNPSIQKGWSPVFSETDRLGVLEFALDIVGSYGEKVDLTLLREYTKNSNLGKTAIKAIKRLEERITAS